MNDLDDEKVLNEDRDVEDVQWLLGTHKFHKVLLRKKNELRMSVVLMCLRIILPECLLLNLIGIFGTDKRFFRNFKRVKINILLCLNFSSSSKYIDIRSW